MLINKDRKEKKEKDIESIRHVLLFVEQSIKYKNELLSLYHSLPKKWKKRIDKVAIDNDIVFAF